jgi:hypothetical protein
MKLERFPTIINVTLDTATPPAAATAIDMREFAGGWVKVASTIASVTFSWYGCDTIDGTYVPVYFGGAAVTTTLPGGTACMAEIPAACWQYPFLKISSNADDGEAIVVGLKS